MKKKLSLLLVGMMTISTLFTGCSFEIGTPSAEKLLENAYPEDMEYAEYDMSIVMDMEVDSEMVSMNMKMDAEYEVKTAKDAMYMAGTTTAEVMGMEVEVDVESYSILDDKELYTYTYESTSDAWTYTVTETKEKTCLPHLDMDAFEDLEVEKDDDEYIVTAVIDDLAAVAASQGVTDEDGMDEALKDAKFDVTFVFNKNKELKSYKAELDTKSLKDSDAETTFDELVVEITFKTFEGDDEIKLPDEVKENAVLEGSAPDIDIEYGNDDDYDDNYEEYPDNYEGEGYYGDVEDYYEDEDDAKDNPSNQNNNTNKPSVNDGSVSTVWTDYEFSVNGEKLSLPCTYKELEVATGLQLKSSDAKSYIEPQSYVTLNMYDEDSSTRLYVDLLNESDEDKLYTDCLVVEVWQTEWQVGQGAPVVVFPGGVYVGMELTTSELEQMFGTPQDTYNFDEEDYHSVTYTYQETDYSWNSYEISITNGVVDEISMNHLYYEE